MELTKTRLKELVVEEINKIINETNGVDAVGKGKGVSGAEMIKQMRTGAPEIARTAGITPKEREAILAIQDKISKAAASANLFSGTLWMRIQQLIKAVEAAVKGKEAGGEKTPG